MKVVRPTTWKDRQGVTHVAYWSSEIPHYGYHKRCTHQRIYPATMGSAEIASHVPTCLRCLYEEVACA